ncbi:hypothetical protein [Streptomyces sp. DT171]|uniref:hypothetical protein n=1 Tax=Streptomyces sp. DT171 TaxID=3416524 RepID=UPI003CE92CD3
MRSLTRAATAALCAVSALTLTACGSSTSTDSTKSKPEAAASEKPKSADPKPAPFADMSGTRVANKSVKATKAAKTMRLVVDVKTTDGQIKADFFTSVDGDCTGTMSMVGEGSSELVKVGSRVYLSFDEALLRSQSKDQSKKEADLVVKTLAGKWIESKPDDPDSKDMLGFCDLKSMLGEFKTGIGGSTRKAGETTVDGKSALKLIDKEGAETYTAAIATEGKPYLLMLRTTGGKEPMTMKLSDFDKPVVAKKPAAKDIVDLGNPTG